MADKPQRERVTFEELLVNNLAVTDALAELLIAKGLFTKEEFDAQLKKETANYLPLLNRLRS